MKVKWKCVRGSKVLGEFGSNESYSIILEFVRRSCEETLTMLFWKNKNVLS